MRASLALLALAAMGCSENEFSFTPVAPEQPAGELSVHGQLCDAERQIWMEGAQIYTHLYDENGVIFDTLSTVSDADGKWTLTGLAGGHEYELYVQKGQVVVEKFVVTMPEEGDFTLPVPDCFGEVELAVAVITGAYDDMESVFTAIGLQGYRVIDGQRDDDIVHFLSDAANLVDFDVLFFDGGHKEEGVFYGDSPNVEVVRETLRAWVDAGGVVYATDWAYDVVEQTWPEPIDWIGDDSVPNAAQKGEPGNIVAAVEDDGLQGALGRADLTLNYDLPVWPVIQSVQPQVKVYLAGDAPYRTGFDVHVQAGSPLLVEFEQGAGRVVFSTFRNQVNSSGDSLSVLNAIISTL